MSTPRTKRDAAHNAAARISIVTALQTNVRRKRAHNERAPPASALAPRRRSARTLAEKLETRAVVAASSLLPSSSQRPLIGVAPEGSSAHLSRREHSELQANTQASPREHTFLSPASSNGSLPWNGPLPFSPTSPSIGGDNSQTLLSPLAEEHAVSEFAARLNDISPLTGPITGFGRVATGSHSTHDTLAGSASDVLSDLPLNGVVAAAEKNARASAPRHLPPTLHYHESSESESPTSPAFPPPLHAAVRTSFAAMDAERSRCRVRPSSSSHETTAERAHHQATTRHSEPPHAPYLRIDPHSIARRVANTLSAIPAAGAAEGGSHTRTASRIVDSLREEMRRHVARVTAILAALEDAEEGGQNK